LLTEDYPPYSMPDADGRPAGPAVAKVEELMRRTGQSYTMELQPWPRAFEYARNHAGTCVFSTVRSAEREKQFRWIGPLFDTYHMAIFARADDPRRPKTLEELKSATLGSYTQGAVAEYLKARGYRVDLANSDNYNPQKLLRRRFDFWAAGKSHGEAILRRQGLEDKIVLLFSFEQAEMYLACNRDTAKEDVTALQRGWASMRKDGANLAIERKYLKR
jgi:polar amino acid transport system substrate-binding protein